MPLAKEVCPFLQRSDTIAYRGRRDTTQIVGTHESYAAINSFFPEYGRFLMPGDILAKRKVCVIGVDIIEKLGLPQDCLEKEIQIGRATYTIVGVMEKKGGTLGQSQDDIVFIPLPAAIVQYGRDVAEQLFVVMQIQDATKMEEALGQITTVLRREHGLKAGEPDDFRIITRDEVLEMVQQFTTTSTLVVAAIVGITLIVGGIGIMNVMLVSVTERTREIGLRKAVGATPRDILTQFLVEAVAITFLGGMTGIVLGATVSWLLTHIAGWNTVIGSSSILLAFSFSVTVGILFGMWPAQKAARLNPIIALRYE